MMFSPTSWTGCRTGVKRTMWRELQRTSELSSPSTRTDATRLGLDRDQEGTACTEGRARSSFLPELSALHWGTSAAKEES